MHISISNPRSFIAAAFMKAEVMKEIDNIKLGMDYGDLTVSIVATTCYKDCRAIFQGFPKFVDATWVRTFLHTFHIIPDSVQILSPSAEFSSGGAVTVVSSDAVSGIGAGNSGPPYGFPLGGSGIQGGRIVSVPNPQLEVLQRIENLLKKLLGEQD